MSLNYPGEWKFTGTGIEIPPGAVAEFVDLMIKISSGSKAIVEMFKSAFQTRSVSTSLGWAESDLADAAKRESTNAALFLDYLWTSIEFAHENGCVTPPPNFINSILEKHEVPFRIDLPNLIKTNSDLVIVDASVKSNHPETDSDAVGYTLGEQLGSGAYGVVHKATRTTTVSDFEYAIKLLDPSPFVEDTEKALKRFKREVRILQSLQHRAIVPYLEAGITSDGKPFIVMPLINGENLRTTCQGKPLSFILPLFTEILHALEYAHSLEIIHRDLKPSNILVRSSDNQPIILDFGSAYTLDQMDTRTLTTQAVGTIGYIPSEILSNPKKRSNLHDIYSCGIMLYEILAGHRPDPGNYKFLGKEKPEYAGVDGPIISAISGELKRTGSAKEFADQLLQIQKKT